MTFYTCWKQENLFGKRWLCWTLFFYIHYH